MRYRILEVSKRAYKVQQRARWWPFWTTDEHYERLDEPREEQRWGGFFGDIGSKVTVTGKHTWLLPSKEAALKQIEALKNYEETKRNRKSEAGPKIVHSE